MKTISRAALSLCIVTFIFSGAVSAEEATDSDIMKRISRIEEQLKEEAGPGRWAKRITLSGSIEAEAGYEKRSFADPDTEDEDTSDLALSKVELGVDVDIAEYVKGNVLFLYEDDEDVVVDEGFIKFDGGDALPMYMKVGKIYLPFGKFESNMISDPLTLELGETRETAFEAGFTSSGFYASAYLFNGDIDKDGDESHLSNYGVSVGYALEQDQFGMDIGAGYINNIIDSNGWEGVLEEERASAESMDLDFAFRDYVPGICVHALFNFGDITLIGEYIAMVDEPEWNMYELVSGALETAGVDTVMIGEKTTTWNFEIGYTKELLGKETTFGVAYQGCDNGEEFFPESRFMGVAGVEIFDETTVALEYRHDEFENDDKADVLTAQLAIGF